MNLITGGGEQLHHQQGFGISATTTSMEGLKVSDTELVLYLHPSKSKNVSQAICSELSSMLFKFNEAFDGVLLAYSVSTQNELPKIHPGLNPYFGVRLQAQLLLFHPKPDMLLEGKVTIIDEEETQQKLSGSYTMVVIRLRLKIQRLLF